MAINDPWYGDELRTFDAQQALLNKQRGLIPLNLDENAAELALIEARLGLLPGQLAALQAEGGLIDARLGTIPLELEELAKARALAQGRYDVSALEQPVFESEYAQRKLGNQQSVDAAIANAAAGLSGNQAQRLAFVDERRLRDRELRDIPPGTPATYRGSAYVNPALGRARDDINAQLGILGQREDALSKDDARIRLSESQAKESSTAANRTADAQFALQRGRFGLRDEELAAQMAGYATNEARIKMGNQEAAAQRTALENRINQAKLAEQEAARARAANKSNEANIKLGDQRLDVDQAQLNLARSRALYPYGSGARGSGSGYWDDDRLRNFGLTYSHSFGGPLMNNPAYPMMNTGQTYFNYGGGSWF